MNTAQKITVATFMNFPTKKLAGRITKGLADKIYNDFNELLNVVAKIETETIALDAYGIYEANVKISTGFVEIGFSRQRKNSGFKDGIFDSFTVGMSIGKDKIKNIQSAISQYIDWKNTN